MTTKTTRRSRDLNLINKLYSTFDYLFQKSRIAFDDNVTPIFERFVFVVFKFVNFCANLLGGFFQFLSRGESNAVQKVLLFFMVVGFMPLIGSIGLVALTMVSIFTAGSALVGLRNKGEYTVAHQILAWLPFLFLAFSLPLYSNDLILSRVGMVTYYIVILLGLNFIFGQCGILNIGHGMFVLIGAYVTTWLFNGSFGFSFPFLICVTLGALSGACLGVILGLPSLRVKDQYLVIITMAFSIYFPKLLKSGILAPYSGFKEGGIAIQKIIPPNFLSFLKIEIYHFYLVMIPSVFLIIVAYNLTNFSQKGRGFRIVKCDFEISSIMGVSILKYKLLAFVASAFFASFAGGLSMVYVPFISPDSYGLSDSIEFLAGIALGGLGTILGCVIGGIYIVAQMEIVRFIADLIPRSKSILAISNGLVLIFIIFLGPNGLAEFIKNITHFFGSGKPKRWLYYLDPPPDYDPLGRKQRSADRLEKLQKGTQSNE